jgi:non-specific serine/threonine protein kinase
VDERKQASRTLRLGVLGVDRWRRVEAVLDAALDLPAERVAAFLDDACHGDGELRAQVETLLEADARGDAFLSAPVGPAAMGIAAPPDSDATTPAAAVASADEDVPARLGRYTVLGEMGRCGMGVVHHGRDEALGRTVAIKRLPERFSRDPDRLARFLREAKLLASLHHPNIAAIRGVEQSPAGDRFLILERAEGQTLAQRLRAGRLVVAEALDVGAQIAAALGAAHALGIIHRDLKPGNVMVGPSGLVKVLDFGLAKHVVGSLTLAPVGGREPSSDGSVTEAGAQLGTPGYMSPEQILGMPQTPRCDVFAFGCLLYQCLTGERAFAGGTAYELVAATLSLPVDVSRVPEPTPAAVRAMLARCLEKDPAQRYADLREVEAILAAVTAGSAPPTPSPEAPPSLADHLPSTVHRFIGREREIEEGIRLLGRSRLVTLTGAGGCGKTRLAIEIARAVQEHGRGAVWFADLAPATHADAVAATVGAALGVRERAGASLVEAIVTSLERAPALLVLDNCEHLIAACGRLAETLLQSCGELRILATSREWLGVPGEQTLSVAPLSLPPATERTVDAIARSDAVRLFVDRAREARRDFRLEAANVEAVAHICRSIDGIPLGIELAAARVREVELQKIAEPLDRRLATLVSPGATSRHETLWATIAWSFDQLADDEKSMFGALATFTGGFGLDSAAAVCLEEGDEFGALDVLTRLVDKSLVVIERADRLEPRYRLLEPIRAFAVETIGDAERRRLDERHVSHFLRLVEQTAPALAGGADPVRAGARLDADHANVLAALDRCERAGDAARGLKIAGVAWWFWFVRGHFHVGRDALARMLVLPGAAAPTTDRAMALFAAGGLAVFQNDYAAARRLNGEALELYRTLRDRLGVARALVHLGIGCADEGQIDEARALYVEALDIFRELGDRRRTATTLNNLAALARQQGDFTAVITFSSEAAEHARACGYLHGVHLALLNAATASLRRDRLTDARRDMAEALRVASQLVARRAAPAALEVAAEVLLRMGDTTEAAWMLGAADRLRATIGMPADAIWQATRVPVLDELVRKLGPERFQSLSAQGRNGSFEEAVDRAIRKLETNGDDEDHEPTEAVDNRRTP